MLDLVYAERGEIARAIEVAEECIRLGERAGFVVPAVQIRAQLAMTFDYVGDRPRARALLREACEAAEKLLPSWRAVPVAILALVHLHAGDLAAAETALREAEAGLDAETFISPAAFFLTLVGSELALAKQDYAQVIALVDDSANSVMGRSGVRLLLTDILYLKGLALLALGQSDAARQTLLEARAEAEALTSRRTLWRILYALGEIEAARGNAAEAQSLRQQAREIIQYIADHSPPELRQTFLNLPEVRRVTGDA
jgi:tetratricopeptide (TPR) repeat protein